jgi:hypothetical protein
MGHPQHHAEPKVLGNGEIARGLIDDQPHLRDLLGQGLFIKEAV